ncbi:MAG TPA: DUF3108 domain-containing protein [Gemmatimonadales bacterium]
MITRLMVLGLFQAAGGGGDGPGASAPNNHPFGVGESFQYSAKLGFLRLGTGTLQVAGLDTIRGVPSFVFRFQLEGGNALYRLNSVLESRTGIADLKSRQFVQDNDENGRVRFRRYDIFPDSGYYRMAGDDSVRATPSHPLDDASFLYFVRTIPLEVGKRYELNYYFKKEKNPLVIRVEKREQCELPDGSKPQCFVLQPVMGDRGIFEPRAEARLWITADERRIPVQIRSKYRFGTVTLRLEKMTLAARG